MTLSLGTMEYSMVGLTLEEFALEQMRMAELLSRYNPTSEPDTLEKLVIPLLKYLYGRPLYFERVNADKRSDQRKWDLEVYDHGPLEEKNPSKLMIVLEAKNYVAEFTVRNTQEGRWDYRKTLGFESEDNLIDYAKTSVSSNTDFLLQIWLQAKSSLYTHLSENVKVTWSNGAKWVVFDNSFFADEMNPPSDIVFNNEGVVLDAKGYFKIIDFPTPGGPDSVSAWCEAFQLLCQSLNNSGNS
ncbi:MAG: hypothetical protein IKQ15_07530 [Kiritimatiellae bacterium]|nr:hypothetical protein [Kiritimatiellia bacterium]